MNDFLLAGDPVQDYEEWSPTDEHGNCLLGERVTFRYLSRISLHFEFFSFCLIVAVVRS
jgi:hypothetical protein